MTFTPAPISYVEIKKEKGKRKKEKGKREKKRRKQT